MSWIIWLIAALVLAILETMTVDFTFLMFAGGALAAAGVSAAVSQLWVQVVVFGIFSLVLLLVVRPWAKRHINRGAERISNVRALEGKTALTLTPVDVHGGRIKVGGEVWSARTEGEEIAEDEDVEIVRIDGAHAVVRLHADS